MVTQGQVGNGLYMLVSGRAEVRRGDEVIAERNPMDIFGELAVLDQNASDATVVAIRPVTALAAPAGGRAAGGDAASCAGGARPTGLRGGVGRPWGRSGATLPR